MRGGRKRHERMGREEKVKVERHMGRRERRGKANDDEDGGCGYGGGEVGVK